MDTEGYRQSLQNENHTNKAINSRITRANRIEREFDINLDYVIQNDARMIELRKRIYERYGGYGTTAGNLYNAATKYYLFRNHREMMRINEIQ